jgi:hypothetical protein
VYPSHQDALTSVSLPAASVPLFRFKLARYRHFGSLDRLSSGRIFFPQRGERRKS